MFRDMSICIHMCIYIYIYIYIERESVIEKSAYKKESEGAT